MVPDYIAWTKAKNEKLQRDEIKNHEVKKFQIKNPCCCHLRPLSDMFFFIHAPKITSDANNVFIIRYFSN